MTGIVVAAIVIGVPALVFTVWPLLRADSRGRTFLPLPADRRQELAEEKRAALAALRELEFEHGAGHVSDADYDDLRRRYEGEAAGDDLQRGGLLQPREQSDRVIRLHLQDAAVHGHGTAGLALALAHAQLEGERETAAEAPGRVGERHAPQQSPAHGIGERGAGTVDAAGAAPIELASAVEMRAARPAADAKNIRRGGSGGVRSEDGGGEPCQAVAAICGMSRCRCESTGVSRDGSRAAPVRFMFENQESDARTDSG